MTTSNNVEEEKPISGIPSPYIHDETDDKCIGDLFITDPEQDKQRIQSTHGGVFRDSYTWILDNPIYRQWRTNPSCELLWITGDPGRGKTTILCGIIDELKQQPDSELVYFFCEVTDARLSHATDVLRGLIYTLVRRHPALLSYVRRKYDLVGRDLFEGVNAFSDLSKILTNILGDPILTSIIIVVDALDECIEDRLKLPKLIVGMPARPHVKWVVSSRNWSNIEEQFDISSRMVSLRLELNEDVTSAAVEAYIRLKVENLAAIKQYDDSTADSVRRHLTVNSNGNFLWVSLIVRELTKSTTPVRLVLRELPTSLKVLYQRMMDDIQGSKDADLCLQILAVVLVTYRPITLPELIYLVDSLSSYVDDLESWGKIVAFGGSFLTLYEGSIMFVHQSAKDFLLSQAFDQHSLGHAHELIARRGIDHLIDPDHPDSSRDWSAGSDGMNKQATHRVNVPGLEARRGPNPALHAPARYAAQYLFEHVIDAETKDDVLHQRLVEFSESRGMLLWIERLAAASDLETILQAGKIVTTFVARHTNQTTLSEHGQKMEQLQRWGENLVYLVEHFPQRLQDSPQSVPGLWEQVISRSAETHRDGQFLEEEYLSDDYSSVASLATDGSSAWASSSETNPSSVAVDQQEAATLYIAGQLSKDPELRELYKIACNKIEGGRFVRNHRRLLRTLHLDLRPQAQDAMEGRVLRFLESDRMKSNISRHILRTFRESSATSISSLLGRRRDRLLDIDRWLGDFDERPPRPMVIEAILKNEDSSDDSDQSAEDITAQEEMPNLSRMAQFITSGSAFAAYKINLHEFLEPRMVVSPAAQSQEVRPASMDDGPMAQVDFLRDATHKNLLTTGKTPLLGSIEERHRSAEKNSDDEAPETSRRTATFVSRIENWLKSTTCPLKPGFERVSFVCGCGKLTFMDVRELTPGGIPRFKRDLFSACAESSQLSSASQSGPLSMYPTQPARAHLAASNTRGTGADTGDRPRTALLNDNIMTNTDGDLSGDHQQVQYLLLCINTRRYRVLRQVTIDPLTDDEKLFGEVCKTYSEAREEHEWNLLLLVPGLLSAIFSKLTYTFPSFAPEWVIKCFTWDSWPGLEVIKRGVPVRFDLVPRIPEDLPEQLRHGIWPPSNDVPINYVYHPVTPDALIEYVPSHFFTPGVHLGAYWLRCLAKKQRERLSRNGNPDDRVMGYGLLIEERLSGRFVMLALFLVLLLVAGAISAYSWRTGDNNSALALGSFLAATLVVFPSYHFLTWQEGG